jgi:hypothetical protein
MARLHHALRLVAPLLIGLMFTGCGGTGGHFQHSAPRYVVTASPIDVGVGSGRLCLAVDPRNPHGVWWWQPGKDCSSRSTGPKVFQAEEAMVVPSEQGITDIRFRIALIRSPKSSEPSFADVSLRLEGSQLQAAVTGNRVATVIRHDLEIPQAWR